MDLDLELPQEKIKILFVNLFFAMYKAATLNLNKLNENLREVNIRFQYCDRTLSTYVLRLATSLFLILNFIVGYCGMAANVISVFPILTDEQPELLLPTLVLQLVENVGLTLTEFTLGYIMVKYVIGDCSNLLLPFTLRLAVKTIIGLSVLNMYADCYIKMNSKRIIRLEDLGSEEKLIKSEKLS